MENVTTRRPISKTRSEQDLHYLTDDESMLSTSFNVSTYSERQTIDSEEVIELKNQIESLQAKLNSAHEEIINLNSENSSIKRSLHEKEKTIRLLKKVSIQTSPASRRNSTIETPTSSKYTTTPIARKLTKVRISTSRTSPLYSSNTVCREITLTPPLDTTNNNVNKHASTQTASSSPASTAKEMQLSSASRPRNPGIFIIGDQQLSYLPTEMHSARLNTWNDIYTVQGIIRPYSTCTQTLIDSNNLSKTLQRNDIVIIGIGSNEKNPTKLYTELCNTLHTLKENKVFVVNILQNPYLNTYMLNNMIHLICKTYENCTYISLNQSKSNIHSRRNYIKQLSHKLNIEIDYIHYIKSFSATSSSKLNPTQEQTKNVLKETVPIKPSSTIQPLTSPNQHVSDIQLAQVNQSTTQSLICPIQHKLNEQLVKVNELQEATEHSDGNTSFFRK